MANRSPEKEGTKIVTGGACPEVKFLEEFPVCRELEEAFTMFGIPFHVQDETSSADLWLGRDEDRKFNPMMVLAPLTLAPQTHPPSVVSQIRNWGFVPYEEDSGSGCEESTTVMYLLRPMLIRNTKKSRKIRLV